MNLSSDEPYSDEGLNDFDLGEALHQVDANDPMTREMLIGIVLREHEELPKLKKLKRRRTALQSFDKLIPGGGSFVLRSPHSQLNLYSPEGKKSLVEKPDQGGNVSRISKQTTIPSQNQATTPLTRYEYPQGDTSFAPSYDFAKEPPTKQTPRKVTPRKVSPRRGVTRRASPVRDDTDYVAR